MRGVQRLSQRLPARGLRSGNTAGWAAPALQVTILNADNAIRLRGTDHSTLSGQACSGGGVVAVVPVWCRRGLPSPAGRCSLLLLPLSGSLVLGLLQT